jgi:hypothetical protein
MPSIRRSISANRRASRLLELAQIGFGGDVVVDGVIDLGGNALGGIARHAAAPESTGQSKTVGNAASAETKVWPSWAPDWRRCIEKMRIARRGRYVI